jgi:hypothetical protein
MQPAMKNTTKTATEPADKSSIDPNHEKVMCDRCGKVMFRMRAVYWCEHCGYKTDCCGS